MKTKVRLFCALVLAAIFGWREGGMRRRLWRMVTLWVGYFGPGKKASLELQAARLAVCEQCPIFEHRWLRTCGSPLRPVGERGGCYCQQDVSVRSADKECWLDEQQIESEHSWSAKIEVDPSSNPT